MIRWRNAYGLAMLGALLGAILTWLANLPLHASYPDHVQSRAYYEDAAGREDIGSIASRPFTPFTGPLFLGNKDRPLWLRLTLAPSAQDALVLQFQPNFTQRVEVWAPSASGGWTRSLTGSRVAYNQRELRELVPAVRVRPAPDHAVTVYVRVRTPTVPVYARALTREDSAAFDSLLNMVGGSFIGVTLLMAMVSGMVYVITRDRLWALDALLNLSNLVVLMLQLGLAARLLFPDGLPLPQLGVYANCVHVFLTLALHAALFRVFRLSRWLLVPACLSMLCLPVLIGLIIRGEADVALTINNLLVFINTFWGFVLAIRARHPDPLLLHAFRITYIGLLGSLFLWYVPVVLRLQTGNMATLYPQLPAGLFSMLMLLFILVRNTQLKLRESRRIARQQRETQQHLQEVRSRHEETSSFLGMLLHEVKSPLSTIRLTISNLETSLAGHEDETVQRRLQRVLASVESIDDVLERGVEIDSLEQGGLGLERTRVNVAAVARESLATHPAADRLALALPEMLVAETDSHLLGLMLRNLVDNAVKYSPAGATVGVTLQVDAREWRLAVRNPVGAIGYPDPARLFGKYYRSPLAMRHSGMGLGLYWVRGVARQLGGDAVYQQDGEEVVFSICLPI